MGERKRIGFVFSYSEQWIAGSYYILNIIKALNKLPDEQRPAITIFTRDKDSFRHVKETGYPYLSYSSFKIYTDKISIAINKIARTLGLKNIIYDHTPSRLVSDIYPSDWRISGFKKKYYWIPDFQEEHYPQYFSKEDVIARKKSQLAISRTKEVIVFSSEDTKNEFIRLYPSYRNTLKVLNFASVLSPTYKNIPVDKLYQKYNITTIYFMAPNQFWQHKNHIIILKAINELKNKSLSFKVLFTGKEYDFRNEHYVQELKEYIKENKINDYMQFLGFIDRDEQLQLIANSRAVIQPSLFEGWSTVVEDAKALNKFLILSDLPVHKEQATKNVAFFSKHDEKDLAKKIEAVIAEAPQMVSTDYEESIQKFGRTFIGMFD